jgi:cytidylate kinase
MLWLKPIFLKDVIADRTQVYLVYAGGYIFTSTARRCGGILIFEDTARKNKYTDLDIQGIAEVHWKDL